MEYTKIKKAATADPNTEFVYYTYSGIPTQSRYVKKAVLVDTDKHRPVCYYNYELDTNRLAQQQAEPRVVSGRDYGVLVQISDLDGKNPYYSVIPTRYIKGLYNDYKDLWAGQQVIQQKIDVLEKQVAKTKAEQETLHKTALDDKKAAIKEFLKKYAQWTGETRNGSMYGITALDGLDLTTQIRVEFATMEYPEFRANNFSFDKDPNKFHTSVSGSAEIGLDLMENLMESMLALQDENKALAVELEKQVRKNNNGN
jgi:hypothetical protein